MHAEQVNQSAICLEISACVFFMHHTYAHPVWPREFSAEHTTNANQSKFFQRLTATFPLCLSLKSDVVCYMSVCVNFNQFIDLVRAQSIFTSR